MYELVKVTDNCYYIQSPAKIGIVKINDTDVCLIDSGSDKDAGKKALSHINANGWKLAAIYNTHSHADHIGGNKLIFDRTGCRIYAPKTESAFVHNTLLEPSFLYGGYPFSELHHKFLMAQESDVEVLTESNLPQGFEIIELPGHSFDMVGLKTPDGVIYLADALSSKETLDKYKVGFIYDVGAYIATLEKIKMMKAKVFIPSHAEVTEDICDLAQYNIDKVNEVASDILDICKDAVCFEDILQKLFAKYELKMTYEQYVLVGSTLRSYLAWLRENGKLKADFEDNKLLWKSA